MAKRKRLPVDRYGVLNAILLFIGSLGVIIMAISLTAAIHGYRSTTNLLADAPTPTPTASTDDVNKVSETRTYTFSNADQLKAFKVSGCGSAAVSKGRLSIRSYTDCDTTVSITLHFATATTMMYTDSISSEANFDYGTFALDGVTQHYTSGVHPAATYTVPLTYGKHTFTWTYSKDAGTDAGADRYYVNNIVFNQVALPGWY